MGALWGGCEGGGGSIGRGFSRLTAAASCARGLGLDRASAPHLRPRAIRQPESEKRAGPRRGPLPKLRQVWGSPRSVAPPKATATPHEVSQANCDNSGGQACLGDGVK